MVIPQAHNQDHPILKRITHLRQSTTVLERVGVPKERLLRIAKIVANGVVVREGVKGGVRVLDDGAALDVQAPDLDKVTGRCVVRGDELGDDGEFGGGVDGHSAAKEGLVAHAERVEVTAVLVANTVVSLIAVTAVGALALGLALDGADVGRVSGGHGVGFPDVHLRTARAVATTTSVGIVIGRSPVEDVCLK